MILVDTSVWIDHLRKGDEILVSLLNSSQVSTHPFIIGELACGNLKNRDTFLSLIKNLPSTPLVRDDEVLYFIDRNHLMGRGVGFIDVHLLASLALSRDGFLWTRDKRLAILAEELRMAFHESVG